MERDQPHQELMNFKLKNEVLFDTHKTYKNFIDQDLFSNWQRCKW